MDMLRTGWGPGMMGNRVSAAAPPDVTAPAAVTFSPLDNATGVSLSTNLTVLFDEDVALGTGNVTLKKTSDNSTIEAWDVATEAGTTAGKVNIVGGRILTMRLTTDLAVTTEFYVIWDAGVVKDAANNSVAASASTTLWSFTTGAGADVTAPTVSSLSPLDNATGVSISANLVATFNETVTLGASGNITLKRTSDNSTIEAWDVATEAGSTAGKVEVVGGTALTMHLTTALATSIEYYVIWDAGVVKDAASNNVAAQASTTAWSFTTSATYDSASDAIFAAFTTPPTTARKSTIDTCVLALKAAGVWTKLDGLYMLSAADSQAALINWVAPGTYNATQVNAPAFVADQGFTGASTKYLDSGYNPTTAPSAKYTLNNAGLFAWSLTATGIDADIAGGDVTAAISFRPRSTGNQTFLRLNQGSTNVTVASADATGFWTIDRSASNLTTAYKNGASIGTDATVATTLASNNMTFLKGGNTFWTGQVAAGGFGQTLNSTEQAALYNALNAYIASIRIFNAFTTPPSAARQALIQTCVGSLISAGVWTKLDALHVTAAADSQAALVNWKQPGTFNATTVNAPTFTTDLGFTGNGTTSYVDSGFNPVTAAGNFAQNSACTFGYVATNLTTCVLIGTVSSQKNILFPRSAGNLSARVNATATALAVASADSTGFWSATRSGASASEAYLNGVSVDTDPGASLAMSSENLFYMRNASTYTPTVVACGGAGAHLSAAEQTALYNALRTYLTGVGVP
jgi:predicted secreted protein